MDELIVVGCGGHAKVLIETVRARSPDRPITLLDDDPAAVGRTVLGVRVTGGREWLGSNQPQARVALGIGNNAARAAMADWLQAQGRALETVVHPAALVSATAEIGQGAFLAVGSIVLSEAKIGRAAILNTAASVDHDCDVGEAAHIGPGARLCGEVRVGARSLIGVGSAVRPGIRIGDDVIVGAGSAVVRDLPEAGVYGGCPAARIR